MTVYGYQAITPTPPSGRPSGSRNQPQAWAATPSDTPPIMGIVDGCSADWASRPGAVTATRVAYGGPHTSYAPVEPVRVTGSPCIHTVAPASHGHSSTITSARTSKPPPCCARSPTRIVPRPRRPPTTPPIRPPPTASAGAPIAPIRYQPPPSCCTPNCRPARKRGALPGTTLPKPRLLQPRPPAPSAAAATTAIAARVSDMTTLLRSTRAHAPPPASPDRSHAASAAAATRVAARW